MAKVKVINNKLDQNLNGENFNNTVSQTIFSFGDFKLTTNFDGRTPIDYKNELNSFSKPISLESLALTDTESTDIQNKTNSAVLNLDKTDLKTYVQFGSAYEFLRVSIQNIILNFVGSVFVDSQSVRAGNATLFDYTYDLIDNIATFKIPSPYTVNNFGLVYNFGNDSDPNGDPLKNINKSFNDYVIWRKEYPASNNYNIIGFTGDTASRPYLIVKCVGNPFFDITGQTESLDFHIKPNIRIFNDFRLKLSDYEKYIVSERDGTNGFKFSLKDPILKNDGSISYTKKDILWPTSDGYNIDISLASYDRFLKSVLNIGTNYDTIKTDLISRFLTPNSLKVYDNTEKGKINKLLKIYGAEFDQIRQFIDSLVNIHKVTYDKENNLPDQIVANLARTLGWEYFQLVKEEDLISNIFNPNEEERNLKKDLTPAEIDIELWRRILINTNYFWKSKGTRDGIKSIFRLIGIPEPFINITEYVYTVDGRIDPRQVSLSLEDLPSSTLPYDSEGYPIAPKETPNFYFQMSGDTDRGQAYMNNFRNVGFNLSQQVDNKKSWIQTGSTYRYDESSPTYYQLDSKLVLNTKEVDVALDTARGIEYDVFRYIKDIDFPANSTDFTLPYSYINISLDVESPSQATFTLPDVPEGDVEIRYNGILLNGPKSWNGTVVNSGNTDVDYYFVSPTQFKLGDINESFSATNNTVKRDVIQATYMFEYGSGLSGVTISYIVTKINPSLVSATIPLPEEPAGDVQLTINGIAATKGTSQFVADYIVNGSNIVIQNPDLISYFATNPSVQVAYVNVSGSNDIYSRQEIHRIDSFQTNKLYFNNVANKVVYKLNYRVSDYKHIKVLINGIGIEPNIDYKVNSNNRYEIYLPAGLNFGDVISVFYLVGNEDVFNPIVNTEFGLGDISNLSFLEFIELVERRMVNAASRKVISDYKGGWYPSLLKVYTTYLKRSDLDDNDPLKSNGYTFSNLYSFLSRYNAFFEKFVRQMLSATIIQKSSGLLVRNTVFTKQKYTYKRGVNFDSSLKYLGSDGATYLKRPQSQDANWSNDIINLPDLCNEFIVDDVSVEYPVTTTTTTATPYTGYLKGLLNKQISDPSVASLLQEYIIIQQPDLLPGYSIDVKFSLNFGLQSLGVGNYGYYNFIIYRGTYNGQGQGIVYQKELTETIDTNNNPTTLFEDEITITINPSDIITLTLENVATAQVGNSISTNIFSNLTVENVSPSGSNVNVVPSTYFNLVQDNKT